MRPIRHMIIAGVAALTVLAQGAPAQTRAELKDKFEERYPTLVRLKKAGRIGETWEGFVGAVAPEARGDADDQVVARAIRGENADRRVLYRLLSEEIRDDVNEKNRPRVKPGVIAEHNAWRNFEKASKGELLRVGETIWVTKEERPWLLALFKLQEQGRVGERADGFAGPIRDEDADHVQVKRVLKLENDARRARYERLARERGKSVGSVSAEAARERYKTAHIGVYLHDAAENMWEQKDEHAGEPPD